MPVTPEQCRRKQKPGTGWLLVPAGLLALLVIGALAGPFFRPLKLQLGATVVIVRGIHHPGHPYLRMLPQGLLVEDRRIRTPIGDLEGCRYASFGLHHRRALRIGDWAYCVNWFEGRRTR
jgi:hypothetical protein